tara:strand:- start:485 stop:910 length:426 start_codon:yes stop_codon:yes gene_type:complete
VNKKKVLSQEDQKSWDEYIKNPSDVYDKEKNNSLSQNNKIRFKFDLHGFTLSEANKKVREIIISCVENNYKEVLLITGKGIHSTNEKDVFVSKDYGKLKYSVPEFIKTDQDLSRFILSINDSDISDGGEGAILVKLKKIKE